MPAHFAAKGSILNIQTHYGAKDEAMQLKRLVLHRSYNYLSFLIDSQ